jgi:arabinose-5-phosphate isomerase
MVMGDALAVCLIKCRDFGSKDFAKYHPGGALGKKLYLRVADLYEQNEKPQVGLKASLKEVILEISSKRLGVTAVVENNELLGIITDGDLRRMLSREDNFQNLTAADIYTKAPKTLEDGAMAIEAASRMKELNISQLLITKGNEYLGVVHFHDLLKEGLI